MGTSGSFKKGHKPVTKKDTYAKVSLSVEKKHKIKNFGFSLGSIPWNKGKKQSVETRNKISASLLGINSKEKSRFWKGGISTYQRKLYLNNRRRALKFRAVGTHLESEWETLKAKYGYICPCCKRKEPEIRLTEDHILPISKGGSDHIENIQPLCRSCNSKKYDKEITYSC